MKNPKAVWQVSSGLAVAALLGSLAFWTGASLRGGSASEAGPPPSERIDSKLAVVDANLAKDAQQAKFTGQILGIALAPTEQGWPAPAAQQAATRRAQACTNVPPADPHVMDFGKPLALLGRWSRAGDFAQTGQPDVSSCSGTVSGANWDYESTNSDGTPANVWVSRSVSKGEIFDGAATRVSAATIGGRSAIVIKPVTPDGFAQNAAAIFPEPFGMTEVQTFNVSESEFLDIAAAVSAAIGGQ